LQLLDLVGLWVNIRYLARLVSCFTRTDTIICVAIDIVDVCPHLSVVPATRKQALTNTRTRQTRFERAVVTIIIIFEHIPLVQVARYNRTPTLATDVCDPSPQSHAANQCAHIVGLNTNTGIIHRSFSSLGSPPKTTVDCSDRFDPSHVSRPGC